MTANHQCQINGCTSTSTFHVGFGEFSGVLAWLCSRHRPTVEQALRRGIVAKYWTVDGYYPDEIALCLTNHTGHAIRENTVRDDLRWLGLTERHRAAEARLTIDLTGDATDANVIPLRKAARPR